MATRPSAVSRTTGEVGSYGASRGAGVSITATRCLTALCTFSKAHTLIWRTRSRETPNSSASSLSVIGSSASRRASKMRRSRSLSAESAEASALRRFSNSSLAASVVSWSACSSTNRSSHSPELPSSRIVALSEAEPAVHVDHEPDVPISGIRLSDWRHREAHLGDAELPGDDLHLVRSHVALVEHSNLVLGLAQVEEQLLLVHGGAHLHQRPRAQDVFLDRRLDPPCGIGGEPEALVRLEAFDRLHQTDVALRDQFGDRQAIAAMAPGDLGNEAQMTIDELVRRPVVAVLAPALGEHVLFVRFQHRDPPDFLKIAGDAGFSRHAPISARQTTHELHPSRAASPPTSFETKLSACTPIVNLISKHYYFTCEVTMSARQTAELLLLVGRLVQAEGYDGELSPAQWMALRYFARANTFSRTPSAFAEFQATTRGTASQAIKALEAGGYLVRQRSKADGRSVSLRLTSKGKKALARDPFEVLVRAVDLLDVKEQTAMHHALHQVLTTLAASGALRCLPGLHVSQWRDALQPNKRELLGP